MSERIEDQANRKEPWSTRRAPDPHHPLSRHELVANKMALGTAHVAFAVPDCAFAVHNVAFDYAQLAFASPEVAFGPHPVQVAGPAIASWLVQELNARALIACTAPHVTFGVAQVALFPAAMPKQRAATTFPVHAISFAPTAIPLSRAAIPFSIPLVSFEQPATAFTGRAVSFVRQRVT